MSAKRTMIRRERLLREKNAKKKGALGKLERARDKGTSDGRIIAVSVIFEILHDKYKFSNNKVQKLYDCMNKESARLDNPGAKFVAEYYYDLFAKKIGTVGMHQEYTILEQAYYLSRDELYHTTVAVALMCLNELWGYSSNSKNTGRLDFIMEYCTNRYLEFQLAPDRHTAKHYLEKMMRKTGYTIAF
jgi:hypothetical protein